MADRLRTALDHQIESQDTVGRAVSGEEFTSHSQEDRQTFEIEDDDSSSGTGFLPRLGSPDAENSDMISWSQRPMSHNSHRARYGQFGPDSLYAPPGYLPSMPSSQRPSEMTRYLPRQSSPLNPRNQSSRVPLMASSPHPGEMRSHLPGSSSPLIQRLQSPPEPYMEGAQHARTLAANRERVQQALNLPKVNNISYDGPAAIEHPPGSRENPAWL